MTYFRELVSSLSTDVLEMIFSSEKMKNMEPKHIYSIGVFIANRESLVKSYIVDGKGWFGVLS